MFNFPKRHQGTDSAAAHPELSSGQFDLKDWDPKFSSIPNQLQLDKAIGLDYDALNKQVQLTTLSSRARFALLGMAEKAAYDVCDAIVERYVDCARDKIFAGNRCKTELWAMDGCITDMKKKSLEVFAKLYLTGDLMEAGAEAVEAEKRYALDMMRQRSKMIAQLDKSDLGRFLRMEGQLGAKLADHPQAKAATQFRQKEVFAESVEADKSTKSFQKPQGLLFSSDWWRLDRSDVGPKGPATDAAAPQHEKSAAG